MTIAEAAAAGPNYIFPMMGGAYFSVSNFQLIYLLYRPLYWFGRRYDPGPQHRALGRPASRVLERRQDGDRSR